MRENKILGLLYFILGILMNFWAKIDIIGSKLDVTATDSTTAFLYNIPRWILGYGLMIYGCYVWSKKATTTNNNQPPTV